MLSLVHLSLAVSGRSHSRKMKGSCELPRWSVVDPANLKQEATFFSHFCWATNIINSAKSTSIVLTCARTSASIAVRSPIISILSLVPSLPVVVSAAIVLGSGFSFR